ncbi:MAG TPA: prefoldin subunit alpha [Nitrososphaerales archaeon]|nr:prefoldin subunit alpha [Nitrososphaerales archaeon]
MSKQNLPIYRPQKEITEEQAEQQLNQLVSEIRTLESYYNEIMSRMQAASNGLTEFRAAIQAVDTLNQSEKNDLLIPIGGGLLLPVSEVQAKRLILSVGAGVALEKDLDSAKIFLQAREKELERAVNTLEQQRKEIGSRLESGRAVLQQLTGQS